MMRATCDLKSLVDYFNTKTHNIKEGIVTTRREICTKNICSLGFQDIREGATLRMVILQRLECTLDCRMWPHKIYPCLPMCYTTN